MALLSPLELKRLIRKGESQTLDFKKRVTQLPKIAKSLTSFANSKGGRLLIGVDDSGAITGIDPEEERHLITHAAEYYCEPPLLLDTYVIEEEKEGWNVLVVEIPESEYKPHQCADSDGNWKVYIRTKDKSMLASDLVIKQLKNDYARKSNSQKYSQQETQLLAYLQVHERITSKAFSKLVNISDRRARRILVKLTREGVIYLHDIEKEPFYTMA